MCKVVYFIISLCFCFVLFFEAIICKVYSGFVSLNFFYIHTVLYEWSLTITYNSLSTVIHKDRSSNDLFDKYSMSKIKAFYVLCIYFTCHVGHLELLLWITLGKYKIAMQYSDFVYGAWV